MIYLDWAATAIPDRTVINEAMERWLEAYANPSSEHAAGVKAGKLLAESRQIWADLLKCSPENIIFTSGGTESNNLILQQLLCSKKAPHAVMTGIEHSSVYEPFMRYKEFGVTVTSVNPDRTGITEPEAIASAVTKDTKLVSVIAVHNETGAVQPVKEIVRLVRDREKQVKHKIHIHVDAVQAFGKVPMGISEIGADSVVLSSHKISGPRGAGILYLKNRPNLLTAGGEQEFRIRPGTENIFSIYGSALAAEKSLDDFDRRYRHACDLMQLCIEKIVGGNRPEEISLFYDRVSADYSPYINTIFIPPLPGEAAVRALSEAGLSLGTGSACSSNTEKRSRGLKAIGLDKRLCESAVRISTGHSTTRDDIETFCRTLKQKIYPLANALKKI